MTSRQEFVAWQTSEVKWTPEGWQLAVDLEILFNERFEYEIKRELEARLEDVFGNLIVTDRPYWNIDPPGARTRRPCFWIRGESLLLLSAAALHDAVDGAIRAADAYMAENEPREHAAKTAWNNQFRAGDDSVDTPST